MVQYIPAPDPRTLLPPLLACLPTAFASPRPPPALLPLLSPILRQRVQLLSPSTSSTDSWLTLLCWNTSGAEKLPDIVESESFELHPVSGEIEFKDVENLRYRRLDPETLHALLAMHDLSLVVTYLWCIGDEEGGGTGWRVAELGPLNLSESDGKTWFSSIAEADEMARETIVALALREAENNEQGVIDATEDDDDQYWAQYDRSLGQTPTGTRSPGQEVSAAVNGRPRTTSEDDYFAQYTEVQPVLDGDNPSAQREELGMSSLNGDIITKGSTKQIPSNDTRISMSSETTSQRDNSSSHIDQPHPSSSSDGTFAVERLEHTAASMTRSEMAARQHISTSMKSLFRLARDTGIDRLEFERLIRTELETLSMLEDDE